MKVFFTVLILTTIVCLSSVLVNIIPLPITLIQILLGVLLSWNKFGLYINFNHELFLTVFIPPLLFFDGLRINLKDFFDNSIEIILMSVFLVFITIFLISSLIYFIIPNVSFLKSIMLSSVLSPTDAVSLYSLKNNISKKVMNILLGEALINDASGLASLKCSLLVSKGLMIFNLINIIKEFIKVFLGGILIGIIITFFYIFIIYIVSKYKNNNDGNVVEIILLIMLPFASYLFAEHFNFSGILSSVISGISINKFEKINDSFILCKYNNIWNIFEFMLNGVIFVMLGIQIPIILKNVLLYFNKNEYFGLYMLFLKIFIIYFFLIFIRFFVIYILKKISIKYIKKNNFLFSDYTVYDIFISSFYGVKGAITLAGVLSIPVSLINEYTRNIFIFISMSVILISIIVGSIIIPNIINFYKK